MRIVFLGVPGVWLVFERCNRSLVPESLRATESVENVMRYSGWVK